MKDLVQYVIPVSGLKTGVHEYDFQVDKTFFKYFEGSLIEDGNIHLKMNLDKRSDLYVVHFDFEGTVKAECDRCLVTIDLPISGHQRLLVKLFEEDSAEEDSDVIYLPAHTQKWDISRLVYEYISLSLPMIKVYDCEEDENPVCDEDMLRYLDIEEEEEHSDEDTPPSNPIWDQLKGLN